MKKSNKPTRKRISSPLGKNLRKVLEERAISQRGAAELAGVQVSVINGWLTDSIPHDLSAVQRLCRGLKVDFEWLLTGERSKLNIGDVPLSEIFDVEDEADFSGVFEISARRLRRKEGKK